MMSERADDGSARFPRARRRSMNVPTAGQARLVIVGATGMVGGHVLRCALGHPAVAQVTAVGRRKARCSA